MSIISSLRREMRYYLTRAQALAESKSITGSLEDFVGRSATLERPRVLELGTRRQATGGKVRRDDWVPHASEFLGTDIEQGEDVDFVADVHRLTEVVGEESFDIIISCSTFEHFKYPHLAAHQVMKALKIGGIAFIQTHQSFPLHSSPMDYFRFSKEALAGLFGTKMGFRVISTDYEFPARVVSGESREISYLPAYLNSRLFGEKIGKTPDQYIFELDF
jgi:SAM-dependent methyltransferase